MQSAQWVDAAHTQIRLTFRDLDDALVFDVGAEQDFVTNGAVAVVGGTILGNTVVLQLAGPSTATEIGYFGHPYDGPWLANARGVGALTFSKLPID